SGNTGAGVALSDAGTTRNLVQGDFIGLNPAGTAALGNLSVNRLPKAGVEIAGGASFNIVSTNVISGNRLAGVALTGPGTTGNRVVRNFIGTAADGKAAVG